MGSHGRFVDCISCNSSNESLIFVLFIVALFMICVFLYSPPRVCPQCMSSKHYHLRRRNFSDGIRTWRDVGFECDWCLYFEPPSR